MVGGSYWNNRLRNPNVHHRMIMKPLTSELRKEIEESGVPLIEMSMGEFQASITDVHKEKFIYL